MTYQCPYQCPRTKVSKPRRISKRPSVSRCTAHWFQDLFTSILLVQSLGRSSLSKFYLGYLGHQRPPIQWIQRVEWQMQRDQGVLWLFRSRKVKDRSISCRLRFRQNLAVTSGSKHETLRVRLSKSPHRLDGALRMFISEQDPAWKTVACSSLWHFAGHKCLQSVSMIPCKCCKPATYKSARSVKNSVICVSGLFYTDASHFQSGLELIHWFFMVLACFLTPLQIPTPFAACSAPG